MVKIVNFHEQHHFSTKRGENQVVKITNGDYSSGLEYEYHEEEGHYDVIGWGSCVDTLVKIPPIYNGKPVLAIME